MLAYRWREDMWAGHRAFAFASLGLLLGILIVFQFLFPRPENYKWGVYLLLFISMPAIFENFKTNVVDRLIGELSYPIYITHRGIFAIFGALYLKVTGAMPPGILTLSLVIGASALIYLMVDAPVDGFRHRLVRSKMRQNALIAEPAAPLLGSSVAATLNDS
jgi:peptidoglycan/LPS O-acetylase OafA/YrhL